MKYIDTHSHFNLPQFAGDRDNAIEAMIAHNTATICIGTNFETSALAVDIAKANENIWAIIGVHPTEWCEVYEKELFQHLAKDKKVVGIGECGLDYYRPREREQKEKQEELFRAQIELSLELHLPLMLHIRPEQGTMNAYERALEILKEYPGVRGTSHFFVGNSEIAKAFLDLGFYISFSGVITFASEYEEVVRFVPLDRILSETDAPFATPVPHKGTRCEPWFVQEVVKKIAEIKKLPVSEIEGQLVINARNLFNLT